MHAPSKHMVEVLTGLGGTGVDVIIAYIGNRSVECHPLIPVVQVASTDTAAGGGSAAAMVDSADFTWALGDAAESSARWRDEMLSFITRVANRTASPKLFGTEFVNFQMSRGTTAVSL
jgi:hypothetical protein